ncbi:Rgg/GadR/MutR family transcriptional regulator [Lactococcus sp. DD01]|uniref:Rgg/GadR/MutR family transcriptional regulator n=1 Tax=Lactococcus sp. DD01 TaxID=1776443 RepID=UPI0007769EDC|nr:Rgg/GadR/MutR family transcriptional regulator [Lactococcus sp. DD01]KXT59191.1 Positive transcriptional regulator, MutR family [Lactococcus sp. DD01]
MSIDTSFGKIFREFRKAKNYTLKETANDIISSGQLSNFENGKSMISMDTFFHLLENINVSISEFQYAYNFFSTDKNFGKEKTVAYMTGNLLQLQHLLAKHEKRLEDNPKSQKYLLEKIAMKAFMLLLDPQYNLPESEIHYLKNYLNGIKEWGEFEIKLLGHSAKVFDLATLSLLTHKMISPTQKSIKNPEIKKMIIRASLNILSLFIDNRQFALAQSLIVYLEEANIHEYDLYEKITFIYQKSLYQFKLGDKEAIKAMRKCQNIFEFAECHQLAQMIDFEINAL